MEEDKQDIPPKSPVTSKVMEELISIPAPLVNKSFITHYATCVRLTFVEQTANPEAGPNVRAAVSMSLLDLMALRDMLIRHTEGFEIEAISEQSDDGEKTD